MLLVLPLYFAAALASIANTIMRVRRLTRRRGRRRLYGYHHHDSPSHQISESAQDIFRVGIFGSTELLGRNWHITLLWLLAMIAYMVAVPIAFAICILLPLHREVSHHVKVRRGCAQEMLCCLLLRSSIVVCRLCPAAV